MRKIYEKQSKMLEETDIERGKREEVAALKDQIQNLASKMKKLRQRAKAEEDKYAEYHKNIIEVEERCRNMKEIVKY